MIGVGGASIRNTVAVAALVLLHGACAEPDVVGFESRSPTSLLLTPDTITLAFPGDQRVVLAEILDSRGESLPAAPEWSSSDTAVMTVDQDGLVTAMSEGTATLSAQLGHLRAAALVSVAFATAQGVCSRTPKVRDAIVVAAGRTHCAQVTADDLAGIYSLDLNGPDPHGDRIAGDGMCAKRFGEMCSSPPETRHAWPEAHSASGSNSNDTTVITTLQAGDFDGLVNLQVLELISNRLRTLPDSIFEDLTELRFLFLSGNSLTTLPDGIASLANLISLALDSNSLTALPDGIASLTNLEALRLRSNYLTALPEGIESLTNLSYLGLHDNRLTTLPDGIANLTNLSYLDLSGNSLTTLPPGITSLRNLTDLSLGGNQLTRLPDGIANLTNLWWLGLDNIGLTAFPDEITSLSNLEFLLLRDNSLAAIPDDIGSLTNLYYLGLDRTQLTVLPDGIAGLANLGILNLAGNSLTALPDGIGSLTKLESLDLGFNSLTSVPDTIASLTSIEFLDLHINFLTAIPDGVFSGMKSLTHLDLSYNHIDALPRGVFAGLDSLEFLDLSANPGAPFSLPLQLARTDDDQLAPGPATIRVGMIHGAPFDMSVSLRTRGGTLSQNTVTISAGDTLSAAVTATRREGSESHYVDFRATPATPSDEFNGIAMDVGHPLVLANPPAVTLRTRSVHLTQAAQALDGSVPLVAGRQALLRVFSTVREGYNTYRPSGRATFFIGDQETAIDLTPPSGLPTTVEEGRLEASFNAVVPGRLLEPGVEVVIELDSADVPFKEGSQLRIPAEGRMALDVRELPTLNLTIVPITFAAATSASDNDKVVALANELGDGDPLDKLAPTLAHLPIGDMKVSVRDPYVSWADTAESGGYGLLNEVRLLRHLEAAGTDEFYHGIFAVPWTRYPWSWDFGGIAYRSTSSASRWSALSISHYGGNYLPRFPQTLAHELGHNLGLRHTPCGGARGVDPDYPHAEAFTGVWGHDFGRGDEFGRLLSPETYRDFMSYCGPEWVSDYSFEKALDYRMEIAASGMAQRTTPVVQRTLLLWGRIDGQGMRIEPPFVQDAVVKLPPKPGPYRLEGFDASGSRLFSLSFTPDADAYGGSGFLWAVPFEEEWMEELERVVLVGPQGRAEIDRETASRAAIVADRESGRIRSIVRDWPGTLPRVLGDRGALTILRGMSPEARP